MFQQKCGMWMLAAAVASLGGGAAMAGTVNVTPANMNGWTLNSFDGNGNIVTSGPYYGTAAMTTGPATPPIGTGSAHLATPVGAGDGAAAIATESYDGTLLSAITSLSYSTYDVTNNGQQFPYLAISINTGSVDKSGDGGADANTVDTLFFEPPYQQHSTGNPNLPDQGATVQNEWQSWNADVGGFWDNLGIGNPGAGSSGGVVSLATFEADFPNATIQNGGYTGLGGIAMQVGFGSSGDTEDGYVDNFTIGINGVDTTYNFDPAAAVPLPSAATMGLGMLGLIGAAGMLRKKLRTA